jgi:hypothetical protein
MNNKYVEDEMLTNGSLVYVFSLAFPCAVRAVGCEKTQFIPLHI